jgi:hypothetical protein
MDVKSKLVLAPAGPKARAPVEFVVIFPLVNQSLTLA